MSHSIYLACPYWDKDPEIRQERFERVSNMAAYLMKERGLIVFSPLSHSVPIDSYLGEQQDHDFWLRQDFYFLKACDEVWVLELPGWQNSYGVAAEIDKALHLGKPVCHITDENLFMQRRKNT